MSKSLKIVVLIKQVPDTSSKAGVNPDGTVDRARAKKMINPFDRYALQKALELRAVSGGEVIVVSMGPPPAISVLTDACEYGADSGILLTDRKLAASDTLATAYALHKVIQWIGDVDMVFTGLQTTDGDTAQTGPQIAERLDLPQITYCEKMSVEGRTIRIDRIVEGGMQHLEVEMPLLVTVANSATKLAHRKFANVFAVKELLRDKKAYEAKIKTVNLDDISAPHERVGLIGSPTVVGKTWKMGDIGGSCEMFEGEGAQKEVEDLIKKLVEDGKAIEELVS